MLEFSWDVGKELINIEKHGISFLQAVEAFYDPLGLRFVDSKHSKLEPRYYWVGKDRAGRILTVRFTERKEIIRIIGCSEWRKFRNFYKRINTDEKC